ncbi:dihydrodipicolinate synthase family protein [Microvirga sp. HBU67558]|uniref:dihydrodipicolinate synthase family protein n=1 Tax=Microvirga TaxID=186650 RepID=UPI001B3684B1|nr:MULTISPECIES: dihydrodipicolinate synthase family protein [unclassified Microvirga]MBQ0820692.1 dihydrodipicolinate synthase family protein [Microvirga sp. HBU67558]
MTSSIRLPNDDGRLEEFTMPKAASWRPAKAGQPLARVALSAGHVVSNPLADISPMRDVAIDFDATQRFRDHLWDLGLGVAEAMDTAQRGMGLNWASAQVLIRNTVEAARSRPGAVVFSGVGTDHLDSANATLDDVVRAYLEQLSFVQGIGGRVILMASRALVRAAKGPEDYASVYQRVLAEADQPVILHWLGDMFDPALAGYWGQNGVDEAMDVCLGMIEDNVDKVDGIKISLLEARYEIAMRRRLPASVKMYTGDDFNYPEMIAGDETGFSHALLGIFDPIAPAASAALRALTEQGEASGREAFRAILDPTVELSRELFRAPTQYYKTGVVFLAYLSGHQDHFTMLGAQQGARSILHLSRVFRHAASIGLFADPGRAASRMRTVLALHGLA